MFDCTKTLDFLKVEKLVCGLNCSEICPVSNRNNGTDTDCSELKAENPEKYIALLQKWVCEHTKTYAEDFFEKFPNAKKTAMDLHA